MKVKVTLITQNDSPVSILGDNPEQKILTAWKVFTKILERLCESGDTCHVESVEILEE